MKKLLYKLWSRFLTQFGNIKIFKYPMFFAYDPDFFKVTGDKILEITQVLEPGDIILRGFDGYLDSLFIPDPLSFSHGAVYIGNDTIVHAVAEGVSEINVVDFCECDRIAIFRPAKDQKKAIKTAKNFVKDNVPYDFGFKRGSSALYCFELCAECYPKLNIPRVNVKKFFGLIRKKNVYLAKSFFTSPDLECVLHFNPKYNINVG